MATKKPKEKVCKKDIYEREILEIIKTKFITKIKQIFSYYSGIQSAQFYNLGLEKSESLLKAMQDNRTKACQSLLSKWLHSDNPTLQMAAYKILCEDEDRKKLSMAYTDITSKDKELQPIPQIIIVESNEKRGEK